MFLLYDEETTAVSILAKKMQLIKLVASGI
jgi:hypothetical protein